MNMHETIESRNMTAAELDEVSGGNPAFWVGLGAGVWLGVAVIAADNAGVFDSVVEYKDGRFVVLGVPQ